jgi:hypothetical protein
MGKYKRNTCNAIAGVPQYIDESKTITINYNGYMIKGTVISITEESGEIYLEMGK